MAKTILDTIYEYKQEELAHFKHQIPLGELQAQAKDTALAPSLVKVFSQKNPVLKIIAEVKHRSPSKGVLRKNFNPVEIAVAYAKAGAVAISVLTDEHFFGGSLDHLKQIKNKVALPLLRKDFVFDEYQVYEAKVAGASSLLLIAKMLSKLQIQDLQGLASEVGMDVLVEVYDPQELAKTSNPKLLGVNNRDLNTFEVDLSKTEALLPLLSKNVPLISESGLDRHQQLVDLNKKGVAGFLIGESLITKPDPGQALRELINGPR